LGDSGNIGGANYKFGRFKETKQDIEEGLKKGKRDRIIKMQS